MMVVRSTVKLHEKSGEESSEDRASPKEKAAGPDDAVAAADEPAIGARLAARIPLALTSVASARPPSPRDTTSGEDGCDVEMSGVGAVTADEDLPPAEGGVA